MSPFGNARFSLGKPAFQPRFIQISSRDLSAHQQGFEGKSFKHFLLFYVVINFYEIK